MSCKKIVVMIDGSNTHAAFKQIGERADFKKIRKDFCTAHAPAAVKFIYYTAILEEEDGNKPMQKLVDWLSYNGYTVRSKPAKIYHNGDEPRIVKGNMDVEITTDMMLVSRYADEIILFTGDADFCYAIREVQKSGVHVVGVSTTQTRSSKYPIVSDEFRATVDQFIDLEDMKQWFISDEKTAS